MKIEFKDDTALLVVDVQSGVDDLKHWGGAGGTRNNPDAEKRIAQIVAAFRDQSRRVIYTAHDSLEEKSPLKLHLPGGRIKDEVAPLEGELIVHKHANSGFVGTDLAWWLLRWDIRRLVVVGFFTNMCVSATVRMAGNLGYDTWCVADATSCCNRVGHDGTPYSAELVHNVTLASLHREFCTVIDTDQVISAIK